MSTAATDTFVLSVPKSTQWDQIVHSCLSYSDTGEVACQSGPVLSGAVRWTWDKYILNLNLPSALSHSDKEKWTESPAVWCCALIILFLLIVFCFRGHSWFAKSLRVLTPLRWKNTAQHTEQHHCMFKNVLQWTNRCRTVKLDRIPASPHWAAGQGHQQQSGLLFLLAKGCQFSNFHCYFYDIFSLLCLQYPTHPHKVVEKNTSRSVIFFHAGLGNNSPKRILQIRHCRRWLCNVALSIPAQRNFPRTWVHLTSTHSVPFLSPSLLLQCQNCTERYLSKETQYIPLCVSQKASQLWVRSQRATLSREPEAQVFVPSQTLHGNGAKTQVKAECLIPEEEHCYSTATTPPH